MFRPPKCLFLVVIALHFGWVFGAEPVTSSPPLAYELMINGEGFQIEADRLERLRSQDSPGTSYEVVLRVAVTQPVRLNRLRFDYQWPAEVKDDHGRARRTVRIRHELGYTLLITDLGQPVAAGEEDAFLKILSDSVVEGLRDSRIEQLQVQPPHSHSFPHAASRGVVIRYQDPQGYAQTYLVYLLLGKDFAASFVAQYFDRDADDVLPGVRKTIHSIRSMQ